MCISALICRLSLARQYSFICMNCFRSLLPPHLCNRIIHPLSLAASSKYSFIIKIDHIIILLKLEGTKWICRMTKVGIFHMPYSERIVQDNDETRVVQMIPELEIAVLCGKKFTNFISIELACGLWMFELSYFFRSHQKGLSKDQIRILWVFLNYIFFKIDIHAVMNEKLERLQE